MIYGINFNGLPIPEEVKPLFAERLKRNRKTNHLYRVSDRYSADFTLQGVCETSQELDQMIAQANNGHRAFHTQLHGKWIGVYTGFKD